MGREKLNMNLPATENAEAPRYLTEQEVSQRYRGCISVGTLRNWRSQRMGPAYLKVGKAVLYSVRQLDEWDLKQTIKP